MATQPNVFQLCLDGSADRVEPVELDDFDYSIDPALRAGIDQLELALEGLDENERRRVAATAFFDENGGIRCRRLHAVP